MSANLAVLNSTSSHGGNMVTASGNNFMTHEGPACIDGDQHSCPIPGHGTTVVTGNATKAICGGKKVIIEGAVAGCGAIINGNFATNYELS